MTRIDFYIYKTKPISAENLACRIATKAYKNQLKTYIYTNSKEQCDEIDKLLWTFKNTSFIPHETLDNYNPITPIHIGFDKFENQKIPADILINCCDSVPLFFSNFERMAEIIVPDNKIMGRKRYKFYQDRGYPLKIHQLD